MIITSTPNGDSNEFAKTWFTAIAKQPEERTEHSFYPIHIKWNQPPGRDEAFKREFTEKLGERKWRQEFECVAGDTLVTVRDISNISYQIQIQYVDPTIHKEVLTKHGFEPFQNITSKIVPTYLHISFTDGSHIDCTHTHRFLIDDIFINAENLHVGATLGPFGKRITDIETINESIRVYDLVNVANGNHYLTNGVTSHNCEFLSSDMTLFDSYMVSQAETEYDRRVERLTLNDRNKEEERLCSILSLSIGFT